MQWRPDGLCERCRAVRRPGRPPPRTPGPAAAAQPKGILRELVRPPKEAGGDCAPHAAERGGGCVQCHPRQGCHVTVRLGEEASKQQRVVPLAAGVDLAAGGYEVKVGHVAQAPKVSLEVKVNGRLVVRNDVQENGLAPALTRPVVHHIDERRPQPPALVRRRDANRHYVRQLAVAMEDVTEPHVGTVPGVAIAHAAHPRENKSHYRLLVGLSDHGQPAEDVVAAPGGVAVEGVVIVQREQLTVQLLQLRRVARFCRSDSYYRRQRHLGLSMGSF